MRTLEAFSHEYFADYHSYKGCKSSASFLPIGNYPLHQTNATTCSNTLICVLQSDLYIEAHNYLLQDARQIAIWHCMVIVMRLFLQWKWLCEGLNSTYFFLAYGPERSVETLAKMHM